jgi:hypothetical protein
VICYRANIPGIFDIYKKNLGNPGLYANDTVSIKIRIGN